MPAQKSGRRTGRKQRGGKPLQLSRWHALLIMALYTAVAGVLVWFGSAIVVRCDRGPEGRVDATIERRFLGFLTLQTEVVPDVVEARSLGKWESGSDGRSEYTERLVLVPREGPEWQSSLYTPSIGTRPTAMAPQIQKFILRSVHSTLTWWWMPWIVNLCAVPFVLVAILFVVSMGEVVLRALGFLKEA